MLQQLKVLGLFFVLTLLFVVVGLVVGASFAGNPIMGAGLFFIIILIMNLVSYFWSDKIVLKSYKARIVSDEEAPALHGLVREVAAQAAIPMPRVAIVPSQTPNAFATGRNPQNAVVAVTEGILHLLDERELKGVIAHEISHVKNRDILVMTIAATMAGFIAFAARMYYWGSIFGSRRGGNIFIALLVSIVAAIGAMIIQMAISRTREFKADATGARLMGDPLALAAALAKLENGNRRRPMRLGSPSSSSLFIANPFSGQRSFFTRIFSTHPPMEERIRRLEKMAYGQ